MSSMAAKKINPKNIKKTKAFLDAIPQCEALPLTGGQAAKLHLHIEGSNFGVLLAISFLFAIALTGAVVLALDTFTDSDAFGQIRTGAERRPDTGLNRNRFDTGYDISPAVLGSFVVGLLFGTPAIAFLLNLGVKANAGRAARSGKTQGHMAYRVDPKPCGKATVKCIRRPHSVDGGDLCIISAETGERIHFPLGKAMEIDAALWRGEPVIIVLRRKMGFFDCLTEKRFGEIVGCGSAPDSRIPNRGD